MKLQLTSHLMILFALSLNIVNYRSIYYNILRRLADYILGGHINGMA